MENMLRNRPRKSVKQSIGFNKLVLMLLWWQNEGFNLNSPIHLRHCPPLDDRAMDMADAGIPGYAEIKRNSLITRSSSTHLAQAYTFCYPINRFKQENTLSTSSDYI